jgi:chromosome segregation ATPase
MSNLINSSHHHAPHANGTITSPPPPPPPVLLDETAVLQDMVCSVCFEIPHIDPVVTPCDHVFCRFCITQSLTLGGTMAPQVCPNDRRPLCLQDIVPLHGLGKRMWDKIPVTCPINNGNDDCTWSGTMGNYLAHAKSCCGTKTSQIQALQEQVSILTTANVSLQDQRDQYAELVEQLETQLVELVQEFETKRQLQECRNEELQNEVMTLNVENDYLRDEREQFVERIEELQTDLQDIKSSDVIQQVQDLQVQVNILESENVNDVLTLNVENEHLRDERQQFVERIEELQTDLQDIKSSDVMRQVQDLQEQVNILESENVNDVLTLNVENEYLQGVRQQFVERIEELTTDLNAIKASDVIQQVQDLQEQVQLEEMENAHDMTTLSDENENLRDERQQFVERIEELETDLKDVKSSDVIRQVQDLQEQVHILESENATDETTWNDANENLRDERQQFVARIVELQTDLNAIKSSDVIRQVQELQEQVHLLDSENAIIRDDKLELVHSLHADGLVGQCEIKDYLIQGLETRLAESKQILKNTEHTAHLLAYKIQNLQGNLCESTQTLQKTKRKLGEEMKRSSKRQQHQHARFDPSYQYDGDRVVELTQLICRSLQNKPGQIGNNEIYKCVKKCYDTLRQNNYGSSSRDYETDIRMLLNVCLASSTWFTDNQMKSFRRWWSAQWG